MTKNASKHGKLNLNRGKLNANVGDMNEKILNSCRKKSTVAFESTKSSSTATVDEI